MLFWVGPRAWQGGGLYWLCSAGPGTGPTYGNRARVLQMSVRIRAVLREKALGKVGSRPLSCALRLSFCYSPGVQYHGLDRGRKSRAPPFGGWAGLPLGAMSGHGEDDKSGVHRGPFVLIVEAECT